MTNYAEPYYIILNFFFYGFVGWCIEVAFAAVKQRKFVNRGFLNGPICPIYGIGVGCVVQILDAYTHNLALLYLMSVIVVTTLEWMTGFLLEKMFHRKWWDYSKMPLNLNGYVCLLFSLIWGVGCVVIVRWIHPFICKIFSFIPIWLGSIVEVILLVWLAADLYVTVTSILKMNRRLEKMEMLAGELHNLSDYLGSNISKSTLKNLDKHEDAKLKVEEVITEWKEESDERKNKIEASLEEQKAKIADLKTQYRKLVEKQSRIDRRVFNAFPKMKSNRYEEQFQEIREFLQKKRGKNSKNELETNEMYKDE